MLSELPPIAGHSGRLLRPDVWELHAAHLLLRLLTRLHLGEFLLGVYWTCVYVRKRIAAVLLVFFFSPPGNRSIEGSILPGVQSWHRQMGMWGTETVALVTLG